MPRKYKKRTRKPKVFSKAQYNAVKKIDRQQEWKRAPMLRNEKFYLDAINEDADVDIAKAFIAFQAPYQDIPLQLAPTVPDRNQRTGAEIYPQFLKCSFILNRKREEDVAPFMHPDTYDSVCQRFRVCVVRYIGEMDYTVNNAANHGWHLMNTNSDHALTPGELWSGKPLIKNQIQVLWDREYVMSRGDGIGLVVDIKCKINKKLTYETKNSSNIGAGNIVIIVSSDKNWQMPNGYRTYAFYKEL